MKNTRWNLGRLWTSVKDNNPLFRKQISVYQAYQNCFTDEKGKLTEDGQIILLDILQKGCVLDKTVVKEHAKGSVDLNATIINEGKRNLALHILACIKIDILKVFDLEDKLNGRPSNSITGE